MAVEPRLSSAGCTRGVLCPSLLQPPAAIYETKDATCQSLNPPLPPASVKKKKQICFCAITQACLKAGNPTNVHAKKPATCSGPSGLGFRAAWQSLPTVASKFVDDGVPQPLVRPKNALEELKPTQAQWTPFTSASELSASLLGEQTPGSGVRGRPLFPQPAEAPRALEAAIPAVFLEGQV